MKILYFLNTELLTIQEHKTPPPVGYPITFVGRLGIKAPAEHFVVVEVQGDKIFLQKNTP